MLKIFLLPVLLLTGVISNTAFSEVLDSIGAVSLNGKTHTRYMVSAGETIYGISTRHRVSISDLMEINPELESGLKVGQIINIPYSSIPSNQQTVGQKKQERSEDKVYHKVQEGETLYGLSRKYNIPLNDLLKWNNIEIKAGQEIVVGEKQIAKQTDIAKNEISEKPTNPSVPVLPQPAPKEKLNEEPKSKTSFNSKIVPSKQQLFEDSNYVENPYDIDPDMKQVLIVPFDPYLYFSDADDEIAAKSNIPRTKVRQIVRRRMDALLDHPAYENIHLLGGKAIDSISDLNKIYSSVTYNYLETIDNPHYNPKESKKEVSGKSNASWLDKQKKKLMPSEASNKPKVAEDNGKYFGVIVKNKEFFKYFNGKYNTDYYVFINQFEVKTDYTHCLDRAAQNFERTFTTHFSIFDANGKQIAGSKFKTHYHSNSNNIYQIVGDNMPKITERILAEIPVGQNPQ